MQQYASLLFTFCGSSTVARRAHATVQQHRSQRLGSRDIALAYAQAYMTHVGRLEGRSYGDFVLRGQTRSAAQSREAQRRYRTRQRSRVQGAEDKVQELKVALEAMRHEKVLPSST